MSHFVVGVITYAGDNNIDELLEPYMENCCGTPDYKYMEFYDKTDEFKEEYETFTRTFYRTPEGYLKSLLELPQDETNKRSYVPEDWIKVKIPVKSLYPNFDNYMQEECNREKTNDGRYGYWQNPNAKWDWFEIGGRWSGYFNGADTINVRNYDTAIDLDVYNKSLNLWKRWENGEEISADENFELSFYKRDYLLDFYKNAETYARLRATPYMRAIVTPDGEWHEVGEMGWWGCSDESGDDMLDWVEHFAERFILPYSNGEYEITAVDCHI